MSMLSGRRPASPPPPAGADREVAALRAVLDQVDAAVEEGLRATNRQARVDKLLDIRNLIRGAAPAPDTAAEPTG